MTPSIPFRKRIGTPLEWLYLLLAITLPFKGMQQAPDTLVDYLPIRELIRQNWFAPTLWIDGPHAYRVPGYPLFLALLSLISTSEFWIRLVQGLMTLHSLILGKRLAVRLGANPHLFALIWTATLVHFHFSQLLLTETLITWLLLNAVTFVYADPKLSSRKSSWLEGLNAAVMILTKPAFAAIMPLFFLRFWKKKAAIVVLTLIVGAWGFALRPLAGQWVFLGAGGGLNLFISTLPGTFEHEGEALDRYWLEEQRKIGHPAQMGWYSYDQALKKAAIERFPNWGIRPARFMSPFFGLQYKRGIEWKLIPFGLVMLLGLACALRFSNPLLSLIFLSTVGEHLLLAPYARFVTPLAPLAALLIAQTIAELRAVKADRR